MFNSSTLDETINSTAVHRTQAPALTLPLVCYAPANDHGCNLWVKASET
jgi:hypothetical protein